MTVRAGVPGRRRPRDRVRCHDSTRWRAERDRYRELLQRVLVRYDEPEAPVERDGDGGSMTLLDEIKEAVTDGR